MSPFAPTIYKNILGVAKDLLWRFPGSSMKKMLGVGPSVRVFGLGSSDARFGASRSRRSSPVRVSTSVCHHDHDRCRCMTFQEKPPGQSPARVERERKRPSGGLAPPPSAIKAPYAVDMFPHTWAKMGTPAKTATQQSLGITLAP